MRLCAIRGYVDFVDSVGLSDEEVRVVALVARRMRAVRRIAASFWVLVARYDGVECV